MALSSIYILLWTIHKCNRIDKAIDRTEMNKAFDILKDRVWDDRSLLKYLNLLQSALNKYKLNYSSSRITAKFILGTIIHYALNAYNLVKFF